MPKYRKKPVVIEAVQWAALNPIEMVEFVGIDKTYVDKQSGNLVIRTLEGDMVAGVGDWLIRGIKGELYPCRPDIFAATYEPA